MKKYDYLIVGAGLFGSVFAQKYIKPVNAVWLSTSAISEEGISIANT